jgi:dihydroneopterin aldolase
VLTHKRVEKVSVTVHKPSAPIPVPFADVAVSITRNRE